MSIMGLSETIHKLAMANSVRQYGHVVRRALDFEIESEREAKEDMEKAGWGRKYEGWFEKGRCTLPIKVECRCKQDCCWVEVNLATLTCWGCYQNGRHRCLSFMCIH